MGIKKLAPKILQLPLILLVIASFLGSIYASLKHISGITYATPIILAVIIVFYFYGRKLERRKEV
jgi:hypothetical protein